MHYIRGKSADKKSYRTTKKTIIIQSKIYVSTYIDLDTKCLDHAHRKPIKNDVLPAPLTWFLLSESKLSIVRPNSGKKTREKNPELLQAPIRRFALICWHLVLMLGNVLYLFSPLLFPLFNWNEIFSTPLYYYYYFINWDLAYQNTPEWSEVPGIFFWNKIQCNTNSKRYSESLLNLVTFHICHSQQFTLITINKLKLHCFETSS